MAQAVITSEATRVKVVYNDSSAWFVEDYFYRNHVTRISLELSSEQIEIVRIHLSDGHHLDAHFSTIETVQSLTDTSPVTISSNQELITKLLEIKDE
jgi:hypothetical protein